MAMAILLAAAPSYDGPLFIGYFYCSGLSDDLSSLKPTPTVAEMKYMPPDSKPKLKRMFFNDTTLPEASRFEEIGSETQPIFKVYAEADMLSHVNNVSGWSFESLDAVKECALSNQCGIAFMTDPALLGRNATLVSVDKDLQGSETVRCHQVQGHKWACHDEGNARAKQFLAGEHKVVSVKADDGANPELVVHTGLVNCHDPAVVDRRTYLELNTYCHTFPRGLTVLKRESFCAAHDCGAP